MANVNAEQNLPDGKSVYLLEKKTGLKTFWRKDIRVALITQNTAHADTHYQFRL